MRTFPHTVAGKNPKFDDEPVLPKLNNLATHHADCKKNKSSEDQSNAKDKAETAQMNYK